MREHDGSLLIVFTQTDLRSAHVVAHLYGPAARCKPKVTIWR
jgi:hypothetical protein